MNWINFFIILSLSNPVLVNNSDILADDHGHIIVDGTKTNKDNIFAGGDIVTGSATVILACEAGKKAANEINEYLINKWNIV